MAFYRAAALLAVGAVAASICWTAADVVQSTAGLDSDLAALHQSIAATAVEGQEYEKSLIKSLVDVRLQILRDTEAMLSQKRASILRRVSLSYRIDGVAVREASNDELKVILAEIEQAESKLAEARKVASQYTGGLIQTMSLGTVVTDELSISQLRLKFYASKWGLPIFSAGANAPPGAASVAAPPALGKPTTDRGAL